MAGYVRNDTPNNIADGNIINASDLDGEFDKLQTAFGSASGHNHSGSAGDGKPIESVGPAQDFVVSATAATPKTNNTLDVGATSFKFKDGFFAGKVDTGTITLGGTNVTSSAAELNLLDGVTATTAELNKLAGATVSTTELNYVTGVTSAIQTQLGTKQATITGAATTVVSSNLTANFAMVSDASGKVAVHPTVTSTELGYLDGVTSAIQTQIGTKQATLTGAATTIASSDLTASRALASNASGKVVVSTVTDTELGYVSGVTSAIQTQIGAKAPLASPAFTGQASFADGSAAAPSIAHTGDLNAGLFFPAADNVAVSTAGVERLRVDSSGNVGIGTTSPANKLDVNGSIITTGGTTDQRGIFIGHQNNINSSYISRAENGAANTSNRIKFNYADDSISFDVNAAERMRISSAGNVGIGGVTPASNPKLSMYGGIRFLANETAAATYTGIGSIATDTVCVSTSGTERMRIDASGNLLFNSGYGSVATAYGCRAWVKFGGVGTISGSGNVTSVTNPSNGRYVVSFTTAMPDANYAVSTGGTVVDSTGNPWQAWGNISRGYGTGSFTIDCSAQGTTGAAQANWAIVTVAVFR